MKRFLFAGAALLPLLPWPAWSHSGGLNAEGCHNDRKRGGYHCHGARRAAAVSAPVRLTGSGSDTSYRNCTEARNAGAAPLRRGEPGYRAKLDRDGDGIACE